MFFKSHFGQFLYQPENKKAAIFVAAFQVKNMTNINILTE